MDQIRADVQRLTIVGFSAAFLVVMIVIAELSGVRIAFATFKPPAYAFLLLAALWLYASLRKMPKIQGSCEILGSWNLVTLGILFFTYAAARPAYPLMDPALARADALIGFNVPAVVMWIDQYRVLSFVFELTYHSLGWQMLLLPIFLVSCGLRDVAVKILICHALICVICCIISIYFPAVEAFAHFGIAMSDFTNLSGSDGYRFHESFFAAREHETFVLTMGLTSGIVSFPSIHAALALVCGYAAWQIIWLRYFGLVLNAIMFLATVPVGAHYAVEVIAGTVIGVAVIAGVHKLDLNACHRLFWSALAWRPAWQEIYARRSA
ncbi:MAG: phosphatase PAP2 family protein [Hyphomicrobiaceae bacterium]